MKRLFELRTEVVAYVLAEADELRDVASQTLSDEVEQNGLERAFVAEVTFREWGLKGGWCRGSLVHGGDGKTLGEVLDTLPGVTR